MKAYAGFAGQLAQFFGMSQLSAAVEVATTRAGTSVSRAGGLSDDALVVRGVLNTVDRVRAGAENVDEVAAGGLVRGVSVNGANGMTAAQLAASIPNNRVGITTAGAIRALGGQVVPDATRTNPLHAKVNGVSAEALSGLLTPVVKNPARP